jgi:hypothetical protein
VARSAENTLRVISFFLPQKPTHHSEEAWNGTWLEPVTNLTLSPTKKYFGFGDKTDYCVLDGGRVIGRIFLHPQGSDGTSWFWTITAADIPPSVDKRGYSATREEAMADFRARWLR